MKYSTGESNLNVEIPEGTTAELLLKDKEGKKIKLNLDCTKALYVGEPNDTIKNFKAK